MTYRTRLTIALCVMAVGLAMFAAAGITALAIYGNLEAVLWTVGVTGVCLAAFAAVATMP